MTHHPPPPEFDQGGYGTPRPTTPVHDSASSNAVAALVLGIASWLFGASILAAIPGVIIARSELKRIDAGQSSEKGKSMAQIGFWLSLVNIILTILSLLGFLVFLLFFGGLMIFGATQGA